MTHISWKLWWTIVLAGAMLIYWSVCELLLHMFISCKWCVW